MLRFYDETEIEDPNPVVCSMGTICLSDNNPPPFVVISYSWGDARIRKDIIIDGVRVSVPLNTELALRYFHFKEFPTTHWRSGQKLSAEDPLVADVIWIDSVCINQHDRAERGSQVLLMGKVYSMAEVVPVWLGEEQRDVTDPVMTSIAAIFAQCRSKTDQFMSLTSKIYDGYTTIRPCPIAERQLNIDVDWNALRLFFLSPWFVRLRTVQEVLLAKKAVCCQGLIHIDFMQVAVAALWLVHLQYHRYYCPHIPSLYACAQLVRHRLYHPRGAPGHIGDCRKGFCNKSYTVNDLLEDFSKHRLASEARDKLYSIYGLASQDVISRHPPNYDLPLVDVFTQATYLALCSGKGLGFLELARPDQRKAYDQRDLGWYEKNGWPTWVPFWDELPEIFNSDRIASYFPGPVYNAASGTTERFERMLRRVGRALVLGGVTVGSVDMTTASFASRPGPWRSVDLSNGIGEAWRLARHAEKVPKGQTAEQAMCITLLVGLGSDRDRTGPITPTDIARVDFETIVKDILHQGLPLPLELPNRPGESDATDDFGSLANWCASPRSADSRESQGSEHGHSSDVESPNESDEASREPDVDMTSGTTQTAAPCEIVQWPATLDSEIHGDDPVNTEDRMTKGLQLREAKEWDPLEDMSIWMENRRFFVTDTGYMGLGPRDTLHGDRTCTLFGRRAPVVLRPHSEDPARFYYMGDCYVHGVMQVR